MPPVSIWWVLRLNTAYQNFFPPPTPLLFLPTHHLQNCFEPTIFDSDKEPYLEKTVPCQYF